MSGIQKHISEIELKIEEYKKQNKHQNKECIELEKKLTELKMIYKEQFKMNLRIMPICTKESTTNHEELDL
jgi:hypothetical protein